MPTFDIIRKSTPQKTFRVASIMGTFDLQDSIHRTVVLPDFQGIGIGIKLTDFVCDLFKKEGKGVITTTSNPLRVASLKNSDKWITTRIGRASSGSGKIQNKHIKKSTSCDRITVSFQYVG